MAFIGRLGEVDSQLGNIILGSIDTGGAIRETFTADAYIVKDPIFFDEFNRTESPGEVGIVAPTGHALADAYTSENAFFEVDGSLKVLYDHAFAFPYVQYYIGPSSGDADYEFDFFTSTDAYYAVWAGYHHDTGANWYGSYVDVYDDGGDTWAMSTDENFMYTGLTPDTWYRLKLRVDAVNTHKISVKIWEQSDPEPAAWLIENEDSGHYTSVVSTELQPYIWVSEWDGVATEDPQVDNVKVYQNGLTTVDFFTANASLLKVVSPTFTADAYITLGAGTGTFTADAFLVYTETVGSFTANAVLKGSLSATLTADAYLVSTGSDTFTADAFLKVVEGRTFTARAYLFRPPVIVDGRVDTGLIKKTVSLHILDHRPRPLPTYLPPKIPDEKEVPDQFGKPPCLSPCFGAGAGIGTGYGANGGATVVTMTHCTSGSCPERWFNSGDYWLGKGDIGSTTHCDCATSHSMSGHVNRMWIEYLTIPDGPFRMRAKMIWDVGSPPNATVNVYANSSLPPVDLGDCDSSGAYWDNGNLIGRLQFSADGNGTISERDVWFQETASSLTIDPAAISTNTFRFELSDEGQFYRAEFKTTTNDIVID